MRHDIRVLIIAAVVVTICTTILAQEPTAPSKPDAQKSAAPRSQTGLIPLRVLITISRYQGEKKISSIPYSLSAAINGPRVNFRIGAQVPYATTRVTDGTPTPSYNYRDVGIGIDLTGQMLIEPGLYKFDMNIEDSSVSSNSQVQGAPAISGVPIFRHFKTGGAVILRDGQSTQFTTAADPITGEIMRVDVTLNVVK